MASLAARLKRARAAYMRRPSNPALRAFLTLKGKAGVFDARMCSYYGVDPNVNAGCRKAIARAYAAGLVPTSTTGGKHAPGSFHGRKNDRGEGMAVDLGVRRELVGTAKGQRMLEDRQRGEFWRYRKGRMGAHCVELIGPINNLIVLRGQRTALAEGSPLETQHDNHVHLAFLG